MPPPPKELLCHGRGRPFIFRPGADLFEDNEAFRQYVAKVGAADQDLKAAGFTPVEGSNAWEKDGIATSTDHVIREGIEAVLEIHAEAVRINTGKPVEIIGTVKQGPSSSPSVPATDKP